MIPDEAVEAAHEQLDAMGSYVPRKYLAAALEAAAPYMFAQALEEAVHAFPLETIHAPDNAVVWMMRRAEELRSKQ